MGFRVFPLFGISSRVYFSHVFPHRSQAIPDSSLFWTRCCEWAWIGFEMKAARVVSRFFSSGGRYSNTPNDQAVRSSVRHFSDAYFHDRKEAQPPGSQEICPGVAESGDLHALQALPAFDACAAAEAQRQIFHVIQTCANGLEWVHTTTGLPWWASIPMCTLGMRLLLLPISLRQAKIIRTNYIIYKEAIHMTDKQLGLPTQSQHGMPEAHATDSRASLKPSPSPGAPGTAALESTSASAGSQQEPSTSIRHLTVSQRMHRSQTIVRNFDVLRRKCDTPHPIWILVNPLIQLPCFILMGVTLRTMSFSRWPCFQTEGALWFPDLTQAPLIMGSMETPLGVSGFILPITILSMTLTSLKLGFGASGAKMQLQHAGDNLGKFLRVLPWVLYSLAVLNLYVKVQLPHAALLHWLTSSSFTLGLQLSLKSPALRQAMKLATPEQMMQLLQDMLPQASRQEGSATHTAAAPLYTASTLPVDLVARVKSTDSSDVLVIMGSQLSARHRYAEAMYCFDHAIILSSAHTRAHYSRGQVFSLLGRWSEAEACFRVAASTSDSSSGKGQALYCVGTSLHTQGKLSEAVAVYQEAANLWQDQTVVLFSLANALFASGRLEEARNAVEQAMLLDSRTPRSPFRAVLQQLALKLEAGGEHGKP